MISDKVDREDVTVAYVNANDIAIKSGNERTANIVLFGVFNKLTGLLNMDDAISSIEKIFYKKPKVIPMNIEAFKSGYNCI